MSSRSRCFKLAIVSTYPPSRCGLATYAADLNQALDDVADDLSVIVCAVDHGQLPYLPPVEAVIRADHRSDYRFAARRLHALNVDAVLIQHEYGIFGGPDGSYVLDFAEELHRLAIPYLVTAHTVVSRPSVARAEVLRRLCSAATAVTVFTPTAVRLLAEGGVCDADRVAVVAHGVPTTVLGPPHRTIMGAVAGTLAGCSGRRLLSTFGLLHPDKGIETAIAALAHIVRRYPNVAYVVAGATHPEHRRVAGERYRLALQARVRRLGLDEHVRFIDDFLAIEDVAALLHHTQIYLTPYHSREQISSGTLTFAIAAGCAVVSTDYRYARDTISAAIGSIVPVKDPIAMAHAVCRLLDNPGALSAARNAAHAFGERLSWPVVAETVADLIRRACLNQDRHGVSRLAIAPGAA